MKTHFVKGITIFLTTLGFTSQVQAFPQEQLSITPKCEAVIREAVSRYHAKHYTDEFEIRSIKLLYGGSKGGLHYGAAVLIQVSDESEPTDYIAVTNWVNSNFAEKKGCKLDFLGPVNEGMTPDV